MKFIIAIEPDKGFGLHWEKLDANLSIPLQVVGIFDSKAWIA
jgi:hypothetical protein